MRIMISVYPDDDGFEDVPVGRCWQVQSLITTLEMSLYMSGPERLFELKMQELTAQLIKEGYHG